MRVPAAPAGCVFLTGAGISSNAPSCAPRGDELTHDAFSSYLLPGAEEKVAEAHRIVAWLDAEGDPRPPRLETVFGVIARCLGDQALDPLVAMMRFPPNAYHDFLARSVEQGARVLTANFDDGVEQCLTVVEDNRIFHFHGSIASDSGASLGVTLGRIERGFDPDTGKRFVDTLQRGSDLVVIGYSGSDVFDVDAAVADLQGDALEHLTVTWLLHDGSAPGVKDAAIESAPYLASLLQDRGARVNVACGPAWSFVELLSGEWHIPFSPSDEVRVPRTLGFSASPSQRRHATYELFHELGMFRQLRLLQAIGVGAASPNDEWLIEDQLLWFEGRYRTARRRWTRDRDPARAQLKDERIAACLWAEGRLLRAYLKLVNSFHRSDPSQLRGQIEMLGRVVEHMGRTVELAWLARRTRPLVVAALGEVSRSEGAQALGRRRDLVSSLQSASTGRPRDAGDVTRTSEWFREAGSVHASLQYRHRAIRDAKQRGEEVEPTIYTKLHDDAVEIGLSGDAARIVLLPGASSAFSLLRLVRMTFGAQFSNWQRVRILGYCLADRLRSRGTAARPVL